MNHVFGIHPKLKPYVLALTAHEFGLQGVQAEICNVECGSIVAKNRKNWGDRFYLRILYCTKRLTWQVLMCPNNLSEPPDFIMDDNFLADADLDLIESRVPSLANWQPSDPKCLLNVVLELLQLYKYFQEDVLSLNKNSKIYLEYKSLLKFANKSLSDIEMYVHSEFRVFLLTNLKVDCSKLPIPVPKEKHLVLLLFELGENTKNVITLKKVRELDKVFGNIDIPELGCNTMLVNYIDSLEKFLQAKIDDTVERLNKRKLLYSYFLQYFEQAVLDGDFITFHKLAILLEADQEYYVLHLEIPINFPNDRPELTISGMKKQKSGSNMFVPLKKFGYNSEWDVDKMFKVMMEFIKSSAISHYNKFSSNNEQKHKK